MQDCVRGPTSSGSVSLGRRGETLTSTRRSYDRDPAEYSSKVQQRRRHSAMFSEVRTCLLSLNDAQRDRCRHFASKGLGVRVPLAPLLVTAGLPHHGHRHRVRVGAERGEYVPAAAARRDRRRAVGLRHGRAWLWRHHRRVGRKYGPGPLLLRPEGGAGGDHPSPMPLPADAVEVTFTFEPKAGLVPPKPVTVPTA